MKTVSSIERQPNRSGGKLREAAYIFIITVIVLTLIIAALGIIPSNKGVTGYEITSGQYIDYSVSGSLDDATVDGVIHYYFIEMDDGEPGSFIVTMAERAPLGVFAPFSSDPLLTSRFLDYDGTNLTCIGDLLIDKLPQYGGSNGSGLSHGAFGTFVDRQVVQTKLFSGECEHYISENNGTTLEQWVAVGTGFPVKLRYADAGGTDLTLSVEDSNIDWVKDLNR